VLGLSGVVSIVDTEASASIISLNGINDGSDTITINSTATVSASLIVIGGGDEDVITTNGGILSILIGDYATISTIAANAAAGGEISRLATVESTLISEGGVDHMISVTPKGGRTVAIGGSAEDQITIDTSFGDVAVCGDHCTGMLTDHTFGIVLCHVPCPFLFR
jgi:hypothetical protein